MVSVPFPNNGQNKNFKKDFNSENAKPNVNNIIRSTIFLILRELV